MRKRIAILLSVIAILVLALPVSVFAQTLTAEDAEHGTKAVVQDDAGLYSEEECEMLLDQIKELLPYGNIGIETSEEYNSDVSAYSRSEYIDMFGETKGTLFLIDMYNRRIQFFSGAEMFQTLNTTRTNEITDNIYTYASDGDYYAATSRAFEQVKIVLEGGRIVTPMRYATNAALAIGIVLLVNFIIIMVQRKQSVNANKLTNALAYAGKTQNTSVVKNVRSVMTRQSKTRHTSSSGGGGGFSGGGGGFSGGGGGGGFSGGGGGHSF